MSEHDPHQHHHHYKGDPRALRVEALESLLVEKGLVDPASIDRVVDRFEHDLGPLSGARVVARAWVDPAFRQRLLSDASAAVSELGLGGQALVVAENTPDVHNVVCCTLCSCYPWSVLGLPPAWYKDPAYRSRIVREPRAVLAEFGLALDPSIDLRVWDSSAEVRYMVLPQRPDDTQGWTEDQLAELVTRDAMIGTGRPMAAKERAS